MQINVNNVFQGDSGASLVGIDNRNGRTVLVGVHSFAGHCTSDSALHSNDYAMSLTSAHIKEICFVTGVCPAGVAIGMN
jgi:hypothetical protein